MSNYNNGNGQSNSMPLIPITGLYKKVNKDGKTFLTGKLNAKTRICVMPNFKKAVEGSDPSEPDYIVMIGVAFPPASTAPRATPNNKPATQQQADDEL